MLYFSTKSLANVACNEDGHSFDKSLNSGVHESLFILHFHAIFPSKDFRAVDIVV